MARLAIGLAICAGLIGCNFAGPLSIDEGRIRYNDVIEQTAQTQLLLNLVRVSHNHPPVFLDVTEVDASLSFAGSLSSSISGLGIDKKAGAFRTGSLTSGTVTPSVAYSESPTIRYIPLQGQALVQQLVAPISIDALPQLRDSGWPLPTMLNFTVSRLTPGTLDYGAALNAIGELDYLNAITIVTETPRWGNATGGADHPKGMTIVQTTPPTPPRHTALVIYIQPSGLTCYGTLLASRLWAQLLAIYASVRTEAENANHRALESLLAQNARCDDDRLVMAQEGPVHTKQVLLEALRKVPYIEIRSEPLRQSDEPWATGHVGNSAPFLGTRSAYAILKSVEVSDYEPTELIEIVTPEDHDAIADMPWNDGQQFHLFTFQQYCAWGREINAAKCKELREIYAKLPQPDRDAVDRQICRHGRHIEALARRGPTDDAVSDRLRRWSEICGKYSFATGMTDPSVNPPPLLTMSEDNMSGSTSLTEERRLQELLLLKQRRYILIVKSPTSPGDSFASVAVDGNYYYIPGDDVISQRNFRLLSLISTIEAVAPTAPLTPTVSVGGH
jgi:hypothetical protein